MGLSDIFINDCTLHVRINIFDGLLLFMSDSLTCNYQRAKNISRIKFINIFNIVDNRDDTNNCSGLLHHSRKLMCFIKNRM